MRCERDAGLPPAADDDVRAQIARVLMREQRVTPG
jgi:hypothetical protein